jgi:hypothetical protein
MNPVTSDPQIPAVLTAISTSPLSAYGRGQSSTDNVRGDV